MGNPTANQDAATKAYVDGAVIANTDTQNLSQSGNTVSLVDGGSVNISTTTAVAANTAKVTNTDTNVDVTTLETRLGQINSNITIGNGTTIVTTTAGALTATGALTAIGHLTAPSSEIGRRNLDWAGTPAGGPAVNVQGDVIYHTTLTSTVAGEIYYMATNGTVILADADTLASSTTLLMVALGTHAGKGLLLRGMVQLRTNPGANPGAPIYLSTTLGRAQSSAPTGTGDVVRVLGYQLTNGESNNAVYFNPDNTWVELT